MQRTPLYVNLERLAAGDFSVEESLLAQLADRLMYIPTLAGAEGQRMAGRQLVIKVVQLPDSEILPVFTTEKLYRAWADSFGTRTDVISLRGGDFCSALAAGRSVAIDSGEPHAVLLSKEQVTRIGKVPSDRVERPESPGVTPPAATPPPENSTVLSSAPRGRVEPTAMMQRPQRQRIDYDTPVQQNRIAIGPGSLQDQVQGIPKQNFDAYQPLTADGKDALTSKAKTPPTATIILPPPTAEAVVEIPAGKPVILSNDTDANKVVREKEDPNKKKKRSLLNMLKGRG